MKIIEELDAGPIIKTIKVKINELITSGELSKNLSKISSRSIEGILDDIFNEKLKYIEQNHSLATYAKKIKKTEALINWNESASKVLGKINGLNPNPGAWFQYKNIRYKVWRAQIVEKKGLPGIILDNNFVIGCGNKSLEIIEIQKEGKIKLLLRDFLKGMFFKQGDELK